MVLAALAGSWAGAADLPLWPGPLRQPSPPNWAPGTCGVPTGRLEQRLWELTRQTGGADLTCGNRFLGFVRTPRSEQTPQDAFEVLGDEVRGARSEVLLASMEWMTGPGKPGSTFAQAVRDLYARVAADPAAYPQGMTLRVVLGGFPDFVRPDGASQPLALARDLRRLGVPLADERVGWTLSILNYRFFPHSHVKLHVIDGRDLTVSGYNFTDWHLPAQEAGGRGLHDLGLRLSGPVAQSGVAVFDDLWRHSRELRCPPGIGPEDVEAGCRLEEAGPPTHPATAQVAQTTGTARAFMLYRRTGVELADVAHLALLDAARTGVDLMQTDFGPPLACWYAYLNPSTCGTGEWTTYLTGVLSALRRGVKVRLLLVDYGVGAAPNRSGVALLRRELWRRGIEDRFEARYTTFNMHTKALSIDHEMVVTGSMNFHFASWGSLGLAEAALATSDPQAIAQQEASFEDAWQRASRPVPEERWLRNVPRDLAF
ncbi:phospholipase [Deinococcus koreensis]|uniref:phospholipase D n=2 Tax=Deinococcus koreensis TaxID=2054903 RepID=A0A2K3V2V5_9DEIO|nr:phospholipase [Deinococcus koreensis]